MSTTAENQAPEPPAQRSTGRRRNATAAENLAAAKAIFADCQTLLAATKSYEKTIRLVQSGDSGDPDVFLKDHLDRISEKARNGRSENR